MKRTILLALVAFAALVAVAYAAAPTASIEDVTQTSMTLKTKLDCGTNWNIRIRPDPRRRHVRGDLRRFRRLGPWRAIRRPRLLHRRPRHRRLRAPSRPDRRPGLPPGLPRRLHHARPLVWDDHIWYDCCPNPLWQPWQYTDSSGVLHLHTERAFQGSADRPTRTTRSRPRPRARRGSTATSRPG
jgi:hypothetical protein